jgi:hypothetical protein
MLVLSVEPSGEISGTLQDRTVTGFLAGRRLVLRRTIGDGTEVWEGWLPEDPEASSLFVAGNMTSGIGGPVHPWYAVPVPMADAGETMVPSPAAGTPAEPRQVPATSAAAAAAAVPAVDVQSVEEPPASAPDVTRPRASDWTGADLSGIWVAPGGQIEFIQEGPSLVVVLPDGTRREGRFTAADTLVVGLRRGCCKGKLEPSGQIGWSDGTVWRRAD